MRLIPYEISVPGRLVDEFVRGFTGVSIERSPPGTPISFVFWHADGTGLEVASKMYDIAERFEVGALKFSHVEEVANRAPDVALPDEFNVDIKASKLVLSTDGIRAESGVMLEGRHGGEILLVAGVHPYTVKAQPQGKPLQVLAGGRAVCGVCVLIP